MKILHVNEHLARKGGVETYLLSLLPMLEERGVSGHILYGAGDPELWPSSSLVRAIGLADFRHDGSARKQVSEVLHREQPDIIHVHNVQNLGALQACLDFGPTVMTTHDYRAVCPANTFFFKRTQEVCHKKKVGPVCCVAAVTKRCLTPRPHYAAYFYRYTKWNTDNNHRFARVIAPSGGARKRLLRAGFEENRTEVLPYFCPLTPSDAPRPLPEHPTITFIGRIAPNKGHQYFVETLGALPDTVRGVMVGNFRGDGESLVRSLAEKHGCSDRLLLRQWASREEVLQLLDQTTVFVFPSTWPETLGIVGLEALSRGVPVVASDVGGVREWLEHARNGYLVLPKDSAGITRHLTKLLDDRERLLQFGRNGIATVKERFLPGKHVGRLIDIYQHSLVRAGDFSNPEYA